MKEGFKAFLIAVALVVAVIVFTILGFAVGWFGEAAEVAHDEFAPKVALEKYEWFITQESAIEKMQADVNLYKSRYDSVKNEFQDTYGADSSKWLPHIQAQYTGQRMDAKTDLTAVVSQMNNLIKEYNAQSEKFNWSSFKTKLDKPREQFQQYTVMD